MFAVVADMLARKGQWHRSGHSLIRQLGEFGIIVMPGRMRAIALILLGVGVAKASKERR